MEDLPEKPMAVKPSPTPNLNAALAKAIASYPVVPKDKTVSVKTKSGYTYEYQYADLADMRKAIDPKLAEHELAFHCLPGHGVLVGRLAHSSGEEITAHLPIQPQEAGPQALGSELTYKTRYLYAALCGVASDTDDDANASEGNEATTKKAPASLDALRAKVKGKQTEFFNAARNAGGIPENVKNFREIDEDLAAHILENWDAMMEMIKANKTKGENS